MQRNTRPLKLLSFLNKNKTISGELLSRQLGISRQALHKQIKLLRKKGYQIKAQPKIGYSLVEMPDLLTEEQIGPNLKTKNLGQNIIHFDSIDSTQSQAKTLVNEGALEGTVVIAEKQSAGKGRMGRQWVSERGGIWASMILRPNIPPNDVHLIPLVFSIAISNAIEKVCKIKCGLKWPNDIMVDVQSLGFKKVCGILTEMSAESDKVNWVILGFGINVNNKIPLSLRSIATNLKDIARKEINRVLLLQNILSDIEEVYSVFFKKRFNSFKKIYADRSILKHKKISILNMNEKREGKYFGISDDGALILLTDEGKKEKILAGDVTFLRS